MIIKLKPDNMLLTQICAGQHQAFAELLARYQKKSYALAWRQLFNKNEAEDVVQNVFLKIWQKPETFKQKHNVKFSTWLYRVVLNACTDINRKHRDFDEYDPSSDKHGLSVDDNDNDDETQQNIILALKTLPDIQRKVINLFYYQELSTNEVATVLEITNKAVESHLARARKNLKIILNKRMKLCQTI